MAAACWAAASPAMKRQPLRPSDARPTMPAAALRCGRTRLAEVRQDPAHPALSRHRAGCPIHALSIDAISPCLMGAPPCAVHCRRHAVVGPVEPVATRRRSHLRCGDVARPNQASHSPASSALTEPLTQIAAYTWTIHTMMAAAAAMQCIRTAIRCCSTQVV